MCVMSFVSLIFYVCRVDGNTTGSLLWRFINILVRHQFGLSLLRQNSCNRCCKSCLSMIDVANCANVHVGFISLVCAQIQDLTTRDKFRCV